VIFENSLGIPRPRKRPSIF